MRTPLYCDNCLQSCTQDYFEDGEMCPYCGDGHLHGIWFANEVESFRKTCISSMTKTHRAKLKKWVKEFVKMHPDKKEPKEILALLEAA